MSEPKLISPLLDNFTMGGSFSDRHGISCCPAIEQDTDKRYIVKIISIPASQVQLDALLLTGAYHSSDDALRYFKEVSEDILTEADILKKLSALEGFLPYEGAQIAPMEDAVGYQVYLLSPYRKSLARYFRKYSMTHLQAVNLGLDLCASLAVCRQAGYLYIDLKPENVFISEDQEYRIGDLGFVKAASLAYASVPDKYRSQYTAPEISSPMSSLNQTIDIYAAGMILYQAYNGGILPFSTQAPDNEPLDPPMYADYEMAEIILKAIDPKPENRWQDPIAMGQALVAYMQRNEINNTPIVPLVPLQEEEVTEVAELQEESAEAPEEPYDDQIAIADCFEDEDLLLDVPEEESDDCSPEDESADSDDLNLSFLDDLDIDDPVQDEGHQDDDLYIGLSDDLSGILEQANELIAHETPEGVIQPEPINVPIPDLIISTDDLDEQMPSDATVVVPMSSDMVDPEDYDDEDYDDVEPSRKIGKKIFTIFLLLVLLAGLFLGGYILYREYYLQPVSELRLEGSEDNLLVYVVSDIDESRLTVVCSDTHGTSQTASVQNGVASFTGLNPNTLYTVKVEVSGFGKPVGELSDNYTTPVQTNIISFQGITGIEDGSVILSFTMEGQDTDNWIVTYQAEGEEAKAESFTGHSLTIRGLTLGKDYTFTLSSEEDLYIVGNDTLEHTAVSHVKAQNLAVTGCANESLTVTWEAPEGSNIPQWSVRCYSENGYDQTLVTDKTSITFTGVNCTDAHTVEVTAVGMSEASRCYMTANAVTVSDIVVSQADATSLKLTWSNGDTQPLSGWLILYTIDGSTTKGIVRSNENSVKISPIVPGATYEFSIQQEDSNTVFGGNATYTTAAAKEFSGYDVSASTMHISMCKAPAATGWTYKDLAKDDYRINFKTGENAGFVLEMLKKYNVSRDEIVATYVIRDANGTPISWDYNSRAWIDMWSKNFCHLTVPALPTTPGNYTIEIYFNGQSVCDTSFTITE